MTTKFRTVEEYLAALEPQKRKLMKALRKTIREAAPQAEETISYNMPAFRLNGGLVYYAAYRKHIGMYPITSGLEKAFGMELEKYRDARATIRLPLDEPLPLKLIAGMVKVRVKENLAKKK